MGHYKYTSAKYLQSLLDGNFRFGRLGYYRLLEIITGDAWIGDKNEGVRIHTLDGRIISNNQKSLEGEILRKMGFSGGRMDIAFKNFRQFNTVSAFVFSIAHGDVSKITPGMEERRGANKEFCGYDSYAELIDIEKLADEIFIRGLTQDGKSVQELFAGMDVFEVVYDDISSRFEDGLYPPSARVKLKKYAGQGETRIVLYPRGNLRDDAISIKIADSGKFITGSQRLTPQADLIAPVDKEKEIALMWKLLNELIPDQLIEQQESQALFQEQLALANSGKWDNTQRDIFLKRRIAISDSLAAPMKKCVDELALAYGRVRHVMKSPVLDEAYEAYATVRPAHIVLAVWPAVLQGWSQKQ